MPFRFNLPSRTVIENSFNGDRMLRIIEGNIPGNPGRHILITGCPGSDKTTVSIHHFIYSSNLGEHVQFMVYADRVEVWNPGELPPGLTPELLREPHGPIPRNPLLAEPLFRVKLVEKAGTGTTDMIADCRVAGLSEPDFWQCGPHFVATLWRSNAKGRVAGSESGSESRTESGSESWRERSEWRPEWGAESVHGRVMQALFTGALARSQIAAAIGHKSVSRALRQALADLIRVRLVVYTMPERPNSRLQRYRMTINRGR